LQNDSRGQWITQHQHSHAKNEWELIIWEADKNQSKTIIIDRTFIDETTNQRWIIDYKTTENENKISIENMPKTYREQLEYYGQCLYRMDSTFPIFLGLYYPLTKTWISWPYQG